MRPMKALAAVLFLAAAATTASAAKLEETFDKTYDLRSGSKFALENTNGRVTIHGSPDNRVHVHAVKQVDASRDAAADAMKELRIDVSQNGDGISISTHYPKSADGGFLDFLVGGGHHINATVTYDVSVPTATNLNIDTVNGRIEIADVTGDLKLDTTNGRIELSRCRGSVNAETTNGGIKAELLQVAAGRAIRLGTTNGRISVTVPQNLAASIDASTTNGSINTELPVTTTSRIHRNSLRGTINGGGAELKLRTTNGGIDILAAK